MFWSVLMVKNYIITTHTIHTNYRFLPLITIIKLIHILLLYNIILVTISKHNWNIFLNSNIIYRLLPQSVVSNVYGPPQGRNSRPVAS